MVSNNKTNASSKPPTKEEDFYIQWGKETLKTNIENANIVLRQLITLNTALLGGSVAFLSQGEISKSWHGASMAFFFIGLIFAFLGSAPYESKVQLNMPNEIKQHKEKALKSKRCSLWESAIFTGTGLLIAAIGISIA